jgi:hypothetical protein
MRNAKDATPANSPAKLAAHLVGLSSITRLKGLGPGCCSTGVIAGECGASKPGHPLPLALSHQSLVANLCFFACASPCVKFGMTHVCHFRWRIGSLLWWTGRKWLGIQLISLLADDATASDEGLPQYAQSLRMPLHRINYAAH